MQKFLGLILLSLLLMGVTPVHSQLNDKSFVLNEAATGQKESYVKGQLIVKYKSDVREKALIQVASANQMVFKKTIQGVDADLFTLPEDMDMDAAVAMIKSDPNVEYVEPNYYVWLSATPNDPRFNQQWGLRNNGQAVRGQRGAAGADIKASTAWDITQGSRNIIIAIIDTGVDIFHPDIAPNRWVNVKELGGAGSLRNWRPNGIDDDGNGYVDDVVGWNFVNNNNNPEDLHGHGTYVAGIAAASGNNSRGVTGISWRSRIMPLAVLDKSGGGSVSAIAEALVYAQKMGVHVVNMSLGGYFVSQTLQNAINQAKKPVLCAAAGNDGVNNDLISHLPSNYANDNLIAVAASNQFDRLASFSNFGTKNVDVAAPGVNILSTHIKGTGYGYANGTSAATPMVAGIAALVLSRNPVLSAVEAVSLIKSSVDKIGLSSGKTASFGKLSTGGRVNAFKAVNAQPGGDDGGGGGCFINTLSSKHKQ